MEKNTYENYLLEEIITNTLKNRLNSELKLSIFVKFNCPTKDSYDFFKCSHTHMMDDGTKCTLKHQIRVHIICEHTETLGRSSANTNI
jgi:hypothetical protein